MSCLFSNIVGGICGADERTSSSTSVTPLTRCNRDVKTHKKSLKFSGIETEVELILARCGCFQKPANLSDMTICPVHRAKLGIGWPLHHPRSCFWSLQGAEEGTCTGKRNKFIPIHGDI